MKFKGEERWCTITKSLLIIYLIIWKIWQHRSIRSILRERECNKIIEDFVLRGVSKTCLQTRSSHSTGRFFLQHVPRAWISRHAKKSELTNRPVVCFTRGSGTHGRAAPSRTDGRSRKRVSGWSIGAIQPVGGNVTSSFFRSIHPPPGAQQYPSAMPW